MRKFVLLLLFSVLFIYWALQAQQYPGGGGPYPKNTATAGTTITNNNAVNLTNLLSVRSVDIPMGAWFTNGLETVGVNFTPANLLSVTNTGDGIVMSHTNGSAAITNIVRTRFSLPWDWDGGTVKVGIQSVVGASNSVLATNLVFAIRAVAISGGDNLTNLTFGALTRVTNNVGTNAWVVGQEGITTALTIGNTPTTSKGILWEIQRHGGDAGDTETNTPAFIAQVRVYYGTASLTNYPISSP